ncbi:MAG: V-type ATP synthase subunit E family protein [Gaiellaceae bacterium]
MNVEPLRSALLSLAEADAERALAEAGQRAAAEVGRSERDADAVVERARAEGEAAAEREAARVRAQARAQGRALVLRARRDVYDRFVAEAEAAALGIRGDPGYGALLERLSETVRERLGPGAQLEVDSPDGGGVRGHSGRRHVDYSLPVLVDDCLDRLGEEVQELWR